MMATRRTVVVDGDVSAVAVIRPTGSRPERAGRAGEQVMTDSLGDRVIAACSAKPGSAEDYPFGAEVAAFTVIGKMFALVTLGPALGSVSLQCDPDLAAGPPAQDRTGQAEHLTSNPLPR